MHSLYSYIFLVLIEDKEFLATRVKHRVTWKSYLFCTSQNKGREQQNIFLVSFATPFEQRSLQKATFDRFGTSFDQLVKKLLATFMKNLEQVVESRATQIAIKFHPSLNAIGHKISILTT